MKHQFDSVLLVAFGGPTNRDEIQPFLSNVTRGFQIPSERIEEVAHHYERIGGRSPLNGLTFRQADRIRELLRERGVNVPVYVGMRNWSPYLSETLSRMASDGVKRALGVILSSFQCEASWERYQRNVAAAQEQEGSHAPEVEYLDPWFDGGGFIEAMADRVRAALSEVPIEEQHWTPCVFTAHSIPLAMANSSPYISQHETSARLVAQRLQHPHWSLAYQSRSGNPREPWLEPDINDVIRTLGQARMRNLVIAPIGFIVDHVEVLYDLDIEARAIAEQAGVRVHRAMTVGDHPAFLQMLAEMIHARLEE
jgi:ferrochelatase